MKKLCFLILTYLYALALPLQAQDHAFTASNCSTQDYVSLRKNLWEIGDKVRAETADVFFAVEAVSCARIEERTGVENNHGVSRLTLGKTGFQSDWLEPK